MAVSICITGRWDADRRAWCSDKCDDEYAIFRRRISKWAWRSLRNTGASRMRAPSTVSEGVSRRRVAVAAVESARHEVTTVFRSRSWSYTGTPYVIILARCLPCLHVVYSASTSAGLAALRGSTCVRSWQAYAAGEISLTASRIGVGIIPAITAVAITWLWTTACVRSWYTIAASEISSADRGIRIGIVCPRTTTTVTGLRRAARGRSGYTLAARKIGSTVR
jgi:hypothetical protein